MEDEGMKITVVGVVVVVLAVVGAALLIRYYFGDNPGNPNEGQIPPA